MHAYGNLKVRFVWCLKVCVCMYVCVYMCVMRSDNFILAPPPRRVRLDVCPLLGIRAANQRCLHISLETYLTRWLVIRLDWDLHPSSHYQLLRWKLIDETTHCPPGRIECVNYLIFELFKMNTMWFLIVYNRFRKKKNERRWKNAFTFSW